MTHTSGGMQVMLRASGGPMPIKLLRMPTTTDPLDERGARAWMMEQVSLEVRVRGTPIPKITLLFADHRADYDLQRLRAEEPDAHVGATLSFLTTLPGVMRAFLLFRIDGEGPGGQPYQASVLVEEVRQPDGARGWWIGIAPFTTDAATALGTPGPWQDTVGASADPSMLPPYVAEIVLHPPGAPHGSVAPPDEVTQPRLLMKGGAFDGRSVPPPDAHTLARLAYVLSAPDLLSGEHSGTMYFRHAGGFWEHFILTSPPPKTIEGVARFVASARQPPAEGLAMVLIALFPTDEPPQPCIQVIAEQAGQVVEIRAPILYPNGPNGPKEAPRMRISAPRPVGIDGLFLGMEPDFEYTLEEEDEN